MKIKQPLFLVSIIALCNSSAVLAQKSTACTHVYMQTDVPATYKNGNNDITKFYHDAILPVLTEYMKAEGGVIESLRPVLTITTHGKVSEVKFTNLEIAKAYEEKLRDEFLKMEGWTPGKNKKKVVCSVVPLPVYSVKWRKSGS